jgi:hypothetical protein
MPFHSFRVDLKHHYVSALLPLSARPSGYRWDTHARKSWKTTGCLIVPLAHKLLIRLSLLSPPLGTI